VQSVRHQRACERARTYRVGQPAFRARSQAWMVVPVLRMWQEEDVRVNPQQGFSGGFLGCFGHLWRLLMKAMRSGASGFPDA